MSTSRETVNDEQNKESPLAIQPKSNTPSPKRKIVDISMNEVKHVKIIEEKLDPLALSCASCNKRLKFISTFTCRCQKSFCTKHRFHDKHDCTFDYKSEARVKLMENHPKVAPKKISE